MVWRECLNPNLIQHEVQLNDPPQGQPVAIQESYDPNNSQSPAPAKWTTGLCGCCEDPSNCIVTCCCPCLVFGQNAEIIDRSLVCTRAALCCLVFSNWVFCSCYACTYRSKLRGQWSIPGDPLCDWLAHCFCPLCAICQEYRELKNRGLDPSAGWAAHAGKVKQGGVMRAPAAQAMPR